jgi:MoxR-like ATPase
MFLDSTESQEVYSSIHIGLQKKFVDSDHLARILSLALTSGQNLLLWGPGGHGKSEMIEEAFKQIAVEPFTQSFGEGMTEDALWGGLDFKALEEEKVFKYFPENSFLNYEYVVFEELFDAPSSVLLGLKDTITSRKLRKGCQVFDMKTRIIIALTNKDPNEVSAIGPAAEALIQRFPLQLKVAWEKYEKQQYLTLFQKVSPELEGPDLNGTLEVLADVMAQATASGEVVSPRTAVHSLRLVKAAALMRGSEKVEREDLLDLLYLPGMENFASKLQKELDDSFKRIQSRKDFQIVQNETNSKISYFANAPKTPIALMKNAKKLEEMLTRVNALTLTDDLANERKILRETLDNKIAEFKRMAYDSVEV